MRTRAGTAARDRCRHLESNSGGFNRPCYEVGLSRQPALWSHRSGSYLTLCSSSDNARSAPTGGFIKTLSTLFSVWRRETSVVLLLSMLFLLWGFVKKEPVSPPNAQRYTCKQRPGVFLSHDRVSYKDWFNETLHLNDNKSELYHNMVTKTSHWENMCSVF